MKQINLILVDDQSNVRRGLRMRLALEPDIVVIGEANNGEEALQLVETVSPDVVVMDVEMPGMDGIEATRRLTSGRKCNVVMLSIHDSAALRAEAAQAGASDFIAKDQPATLLLAAIRRAASHSDDQQ